MSDRNERDTGARSVPEGPAAAPDQQLQPSPAPAHLPRSGDGPAPEPIESTAPAAGSPTAIGVSRRERAPRWSDGSILEIDVAVERGEPTFPMLMRMLYVSGSTQGAEGAPDERLARYLDTYRATIECFSTRHGGIAESFYADEFVAGALLTGSGRLCTNIWWDDFKFPTARARELDAELNDLCGKAGAFLEPECEQRLVQRLFRLYKGLISCLRREWWRHSCEAKEASPEYHADMDQLEGEYRKLVAAYQQLGQMASVGRYLLGAGIGTVLIAAAVGLLELVLPGSHQAAWVGALAGGAVGGFLSVLERFTRGALTVGFEVHEKPMITLSGASRPVIGAIFGLALYVLVSSGILPIEVKVEPARLSIFFAGLGFLAGFSERLAKDAFEKAGRSIG